ncbi:hypothetical protein DFJ73DRAFT_635451 [Zopfochytrium polystomum]|nr:hypothetical protein DFJ73DRAFT_635612 [Zopfochytrium polystomum]KAI9318874.1 hypothetical protein DFJ73DRAFT_635451 [Zopfochytrium polystomum]
MIATLLRLHTRQAADLLSLHRRSLDRVRSPAALDFLLRHLPRSTLDDLRRSNGASPSSALYTNDAIDKHAQSPDLLQWWKDSGFELKYSEKALDNAGSVEMLQWWKDSGLPLKYSVRAINVASRRGRVDLLWWWRDCGLELKYDEDAVNSASANGRVDVLRWWRDCGLTVKYDNSATRRASHYGHVDVLQWWWKDSGLEFKYDERSVAWMPCYRRTDLLRWNKKGGGGEVPLATPTESVRAAVSRRNVACLQWWRDSGLEIDWLAVPLAAADDGQVLKWWEASGLFALWMARQPDVRKACQLGIDRAFLTAVEEWWRERMASA